MTKRLVAYWVGWWLASMALWLLLTSTVAFNEVFTGFAVAAVAAGATTTVHAHQPVPTTPRPEWIRYVLGLPVRIAADTWLLVLALGDRLRGGGGGRGGRAPGRFEEVRMLTTRRASDRRGMETLSTIIVSMSPNHIVVGFDEQRRIVLLHELVRRQHNTLEEVMLKS
jgi:multisubunit Na+/H+ antiporter MnhE subunit